MKAHIFLFPNPKFQLQILCSFGDITKNVNFIGIPENNFLCFFINSLISRGAYFLLPLESKQEASSGWNFTKCISEVKVNQLKVKNKHVKMGNPPLNITLCWMHHFMFDECHCIKCYSNKIWFDTPNASWDTSKKNCQNIKCFQHNHPISSTRSSAVPRNVPGGRVCYSRNMRTIQLLFQISQVLVKGACPILRFFQTFWDFDIKKS